MGQTNSDGIFTPDEDDTMEADVWSQMMAESISQGLGKRMKLQETRVSLRATAPVPFDVDSRSGGLSYVQVPLAIAANTGIRFPEPDYSGGNHAEGVIIEGDYAKIVTPGLYTIIGQVTIHNSGVEEYPNHSWDFFGSVGGQVIGLPTYGATNGVSYTYGSVSDTRFLAKDDMISLTVGVGTDHVGAFRVQDALLTLSMQYAIPEA